MDFLTERLEYNHIRVDHFASVRFFAIEFFKMLTLCATAEYCTVGPIQDVNTRWNSELDVLAQLCEYHSEVNLALPDRYPEHLTEEDWSAIQLAVDFLKTPAAITTLLEVPSITCLLSFDI